ncbi:helix-turn-helix domain-containing protein [Virgibacillus dakarensis]|uniref:helix-turn-helix domain-containing protein n=1 Tax=Virgibacillus dakarensis TaxID=1917889 RepID=UPI000B441B2C|nr:helix-turn-helix transcriptional regulator [Virgibacillus dakarensis]
MEDKELEKLLALELGNHIRYRRKKVKELTMERLAEIADIDDKSLGKNERGERLPKITTLYKLRKHLGISVDSVIDQIIIEENKRN